MSIRLITFDLDDTLWPAAPVIERAERVLRQWLADRVPRLGDFTPERLAAFRQRVLAREPLLCHRVSGLRRQVLRLALAEAGYAGKEQEQLAEQGFQVFLEARNQIAVADGVHQLLARLQGRYVLGVLTNGNADVRRLGLGQYFDFILCAEELGVGKPDPHPFREALRRGGVAAGQALHVGDHPLDDMTGARQAGLRSVWFNPDDRPWPGGAEPDARIRRLDELPGLLARWSRPAP